MAFTEDLSAYLVDFGVNATSGSSSGLVIFNQPSADLFDGMQVSSDFTIRYISSEFPALHDGVAITVNSQSYQVRGEPMALSDGKFSQASLRRA